MFVCGRKAKKKKLNIHNESSFKNTCKQTKSIQNIVLPISTMNKITIVMPDLNAQKSFATFVASINKSKVAVQKALDEAQLLFDSLMQEYFG